MGCAVAAVERSHGAFGKFRHDFDSTGNSRGIDASVGGNDDSRPIRRPRVTASSIIASLA
jgi:hypothetical protein